MDPRFIQISKNAVAMEKGTIRSEIKEQISCTLKSTLGSLSSSYMISRMENSFNSLDSIKRRVVTRKITMSNKSVEERLDLASPLIEGAKKWRSNLTSSELLEFSNKISKGVKITQSKMTEEYKAEINERRSKTYLKTVESLRFRSPSIISSAERDFCFYLASRGKSNFFFYNGQGQFSSILALMGYKGNKIPDFISKIESLVVDILGGLDRWHFLGDDILRVEEFSKYNIKCICLWEDELLDYEYLDSIFGWSGPSYQVFPDSNITRG